MKTFSIKEAFRAGWEKWKEHKKVITIATLIMVILEILSDDRTHGIGVIAFLFFLVSLAIDMGWLKMLLRTTHGEMPKVSDLTDHIHLIWKYLAVSIVVILIVVGGLILLIVPGVYWALKYAFAPLLVLDKELPIKEALRKSGEMTDGIKWKLLGFLILVGFVSASGVIALGFGLLITIPVATLAFLSVYKKLVSLEVTIAPVVEVSPTA